MISLIFVGLQVQQSNEQAALTTNALRLTAYAQLVDGISDFNIQTLQNAELRSVRTKLEAGTQLDELNPDEQQIINAFLFLAYRNGDLAYMQYSQGVIDEERLISGMGLLINYLAFPTVRAHWDRVKMGFVAEYRTYIDQLVENTKSN